MIMTFLEKFSCLVANLVGIAKIMDLDPVHLRHQTHHLQCIVLTPQGDGKLYDFRCKSEQGNGHKIVR